MPNEQKLPFPAPWRCTTRNRAPARSVVRELLGYFFLSSKVTLFFVWWSGYENLTSLSGHLKGKYVQIRRPVYFCCLGNFLSSSVFHYPRVRLLGRKTSQSIQRWKGKKLTDSFGKRIKIYTVKLPPVSDRKNAKISYVVAYENQTTWGMYRENLTHLREVLITEFWLANRMFFFCLSGRSTGGVRQKNVVKYIKTSYSDVQWTRILFVVLNLENLYRLHRKRQSSRVQIVNTLTCFSAILA